jgi:hypothetical protein
MRAVQRSWKGKEIHDLHTFEAPKSMTLLHSVLVLSSMSIFKYTNLAYEAKRCQQLK